jgi:hypothetical protein
LRCVVMEMSVCEVVWWFIEFVVMMSVDDE